MNYKEATKVLGGLLDAFDRDEHGDYFYEHGWEVCEATILAYGALQNQPFWIPVEERLPEKYTLVLCYKDGQRRLGYYIGAEYGKGVAAFRHPKDQWAFGVTHWMPLPEPPEVEV